MNQYTAAVILYLLLVIATCVAMYITDSGWWLVLLCLVDVDCGTEKDKKND